MECAAEIRTHDFLIVDDDAIFRERLMRALRDRGYSVVSAGCVDGAIDLLKSEQILRVIIDLRMPGKNGLELVEYLSRQETSPEAVVLTGYGSITSAMSAMRLGVRNYLTKPVGISEILTAFEEIATAKTDVPVPSLAQVEWDHIQRVVSDCDGNVSKAAKLLGMHRRSLQRKLQKDPSRMK